MPNPYHNSYTHNVTDEKLLKIAKSDNLRKKIEILLLLKDYECIQEAFNLTPSQIEVYKGAFFDIDPLLSEGKAFVIEYLSQRSDAEYLKCYILGIDYARGKFGFTKELSDKKQVIRQIVSKVLLDNLSGTPSVGNIKNIAKMLGDIKNEQKGNTIENLIKELQKMGEIDGRENTTSDKPST